MKIFTLLCSLLFCLHSFPAHLPGGSSREVPVLMYHSVCRFRTNDYILHPDKFDADMKYIVDHGYEPVFLNELTAFCEGGELPEKPIVVTFDDGFYNNLSVVLPIAQKYDVKCQLNIVGKYVEKDSGDRHDSYSYLSPAEIKELRASGLFEIGNHSYDMHRRDKRLGVAARKGEDEVSYEKALTADSERCRSVLREECGIETHIFALPFGHYSKTTIPVLAKLGYRWVLTCEEGTNKIERGQTGTGKLKRFNRPNKYTTEEFFRKCKIK